MAPRMSLGLSTLLALGLLLLVLPCQVHAFGAGNIASISKVEGKNWRHGDIEDMLKTIAFIKGHKWTSNMVKRVYFGNWLRDYSQAMDVGTLKSLPADTIRILVWILSFLSFGYATAEFEVTAERLGVYRPEEHIDNPKDYADNEDARQYDDRLRGPIRQVELDIDPDTGMKNYIANERGDWATSAAYIKFSLARSIHYGRLYTNGHRKGNEEDLFEALRCLGQGLHTLEDFAAHTNYIELALREMGFRNVFPHTGTQTEINLRGHHVYPLVTGTFGMVDFFHSVLGEATDHFTQSEINEMDTALGDAQSSSSANSLNSLTGLLGKVPGCGDLVAEAEALKRRSEAQQSSNSYGGARSGYAAEATRGFNDDSERSRGGYEQSRADAPSSTNNKPTGLPGMPDFNPAETIAKIYPILEFRDKVVRKISSIIEKIPGLESLVEKITETLTIFIMSLLAPFIRPIINAASQSLQTGSAGVIESSGKHQFEPWTNPHCNDPTHSMLSKDHFSNVLNEPAGHVASAILKYVTPRVLHAWENINMSEQQVLHDCLEVFHHPALRNMRNEAHRTMFEAVKSWVDHMPDRGAKLNDILSSEGVKTGKNNGGEVGHSHSHGGGGFAALGGAAHGQSHQSSTYGSQQHYQQPHQSSHQQHQQSSTSGSGGSQLPWEKLSDQLNSLPIPGISNINKLSSKLSGFGLGGSSRDEKDDNPSPPPQQHHYEPQSHSQSHYQQSTHTPPPHHQSGGHGGYGAPSYDGYNQPPPHHGGYGHDQSGYGQPPPPHQGYGQDYGQGHQPPYHQPPHHQPPHHQHGGHGQGHGYGHGQGGYGGGYGY
ncbi:heterokaryon incompatibility protein Het-C-domain-containing protein [Aspergillus karnatakaensis]|uniref:heterokaryon incompatibility protein Het-C-domain-containing protein n=1 Tax=Aspergillus karnatakaensis TaxID=1810916 RepID=UPI003CCD0208